MIFNIVSGGLNLRDAGSFVSQESYVLAVTNLVLCIIWALMLLPKCYAMIKNRKTSSGPQIRGMSRTYCVFLMMIVVFNIAFSAIVMKYYTDRKVIDKTMHDLSMSIVIVDSLFTIQYLGSSKF